MAQGRKRCWGALRHSPTPPHPTPLKRTLWKTLLSSNCRYAKSPFVSPVGNGSLFVSCQLCIPPVCPREESGASRVWHCQLSAVPREPANWAVSVGNDPGLDAGARSGLPAGWDGNKSRSCSMLRWGSTSLRGKEAGHPLFLKHLKAGGKRQGMAISLCCTCRVQGLLGTSHCWKLDQTVGPDLARQPFWDGRSGFGRRGGIRSQLWGETFSHSRKTHWAPSFLWGEIAGGAFPGQARQ